LTREDIRALAKLADTNMTQAESGMRSDKFSLAALIAKYQPRVALGSLSK
jgi:hypothetical protein